MPCTSGAAEPTSGGVHAHVAEATRRRAVADVDGLARLSLAAVDHAQHLPLVGPGDGVAGAPELRGDAAVQRIAHQPGAPAVLDQPPVLGAELEVEAAVVDAPGPVGLQVDAVLGAGDHLL